MPKLVSFISKVDTYLAHKAVQCATDQANAYLSTEENYKIIETSTQLVMIDNKPVYVITILCKE